MRVCVCVWRYEVVSFKEEHLQGGTLHHMHDHLLVLTAVSMATRVKKGVHN